MEIKGEYRIAAPREKVFAALNDASVLQACIPGCESLEKVSDTEMTAKVRLRIGPVSASFSGKVMLSDIDPPNGYKISGEGQGGVAGFAKGGAVVTLREEGSETVLDYNADAQVGGKIAQVGARLITGTARKLADEFFGKLATTINNPSPAAVAGVASSVEPPPPAPPLRSDSAERGYRHWFVIAAGATVLVLVFLASR
ncbi:MAG: carbon monoxide dehydrogenase subunit G [Alphaproteobacteria bacterium]|nr:carbon monoxide dehydrogenase subunit G [Alphaproteobacteria bacterium]MBV8412547.1 carbon monoxide dehydrogenase subunit G [Alphaproteobacteria bacterium]